MRASVIHNTNKLISSSDESWGSIRENTLVRVGEDGNFYTIGSVLPLMYIKDFQTISKNVIKVNGDISTELVPGDTCLVTYKEHEVLTILKPLDAGSKYKVSDILFLEGGKISKNSITGEPDPAKFIVSSVGQNGEIIQLRMESKGRYITAPPEECNLIGGSGSGGKALVNYRVTDDRANMEKTIINIEKNAGYSLISLDSELIDFVSCGKISVNKWQAVLTSNYAGASKINCKIEFVRDFTPFMRIPLIAKGNLAPEVVYNTALLTVDKEMEKMAEEIKKLKSRFS